MSPAQMNFQISLPKNTR